MKFLTLFLFSASATFLFCRHPSGFDRLLAFYWITRNGMENLYKDLFDVSGLLAEQVGRYLLEMVGPEGPALVVVTPNRRVQTRHPGRVGVLLSENERLVGDLCARLDDGEDPLVVKVEGGCIAACQLASERAHCGYLLIFLEGYTLETAGANMRLVELIVAQAGLICELVEKNNHLHQLKLVHLSRTSQILCP